MVIRFKKSNEDKKKDKPVNEIDSIVNLIGSKPKSNDAREIFLNKKLAQVDQWFEQHQSKYFMRAYLFVLVLLAIVYFLLPVSKLDGIVVQGNHYISEIYAKRIIRDNSSTIALFNIEPLIDHKLRKNAWIDDVDVTIDQNRILHVSIKENQPVGYYINEDLQTTILFKDGQTKVATAYETDTLSQIPLIVRFDETQMSRIITAFKEVDPIMIESIAEIDRLQLSYDDNVLMLTMADGNYFIGSRFGMETLNQYRLIASKLQGNGHCLYATDNKSVVYKSACPWIEPEERPVEYFLDCDGNPILDHLGNPIAIQYLSDAHGNYIYDSKGHKTITNQIEMPNCELPQEEQDVGEVIVQTPQE